MSFKQSITLQFITFLISITLFTWFLILSSISTQIMVYLNLNWTILFALIITFCTLSLMSTYVKIYVLPVLENKSKLKEITREFESNDSDADNN